jgi:hypothetical protein
VQGRCRLASSRTPARVTAPFVGKARLALGTYEEFAGDVVALLSSAPRCWSSGADQDAMLCSSRRVAFVVNEPTARRRSSSVSGPVGTGRSAQGDHE